jgi:phosphatidylinositol alpha-1,6-mannosyltransferase
MKVLLFTIEYPPFYGGVANYYFNLKKYWPKLEEILVLNNNNDELINKKYWFLKWLPSIWKLFKAVKTERINHILVGHILPLGTSAYIIKKILKTSYTIFLHGMDFTYALKSWRKKILVKILLLNSKNIICVNSYVAGLVIDFLPELQAKITIINPGVEKIKTEKNSALAGELKNKYDLENKIILLTICRLVKRKGVDKVLEGLPEAIKAAPNLKYIIIGKGEEEENLKFKILNLKLEDKAFLLTDVSDEEKYAWLHLCDIFIMPAREIKGDVEGFGIVYLEANIYNKPVIAGASGGVGDAIIHGLNGLLVNPENINEITKAIIQLARDEALRGQLGEAGRLRAEKEFNWQAQGEKIYNLIHKQ